MQHFVRKKLNHPCIDELKSLLCKKGSVENHPSPTWNGPCLVFEGLPVLFKAPIPITLYKSGFYSMTGYLLGTVLHYKTWTWKKLCTDFFFIRKWTKLSTPPPLPPWRKYPQLWIKFRWYHFLESKSRKSNLQFCSRYP